VLPTFIAVDFAGRNTLLMLKLAVVLLATQLWSSEAVNLTRHSGDHYDPSWSPDGTIVLFESTCNPNAHPGWQLQTVAADGSGITSTIEGRVDFRPLLSPDGKKLLFDSARDGNHEIYVSDPDGTNAVRLTSDPAYDSGASWSPDGQWLVYFSGSEPLGGSPLRGYGDADLWIMRRDGTGKRRLTNRPDDDTYPSWSPDGSRIAFTSWRDGNPEIYVVNPDGSGEKRLTRSIARDDGAKWSPDSKMIAFSSLRDGNYEIYVMGADGNGLLNVTNHPTTDAGVAWSPDGKWLAISSKRDGNYEIYRIPAPRLTDVTSASAAARANATTPFNITRNPSVDLYPSWSPDGRSVLFSSERNPMIAFRDSALLSVDVETGTLTAFAHGSADARASWSPDGKQIVFESDRDGDLDLYLMEPGTSTVRKLLDAPGAQSAPRWSPDGKRIVYGSTAPGAASEIFIMDADGSNAVNVTQHQASDSVPSWSSDGARIAFASNRDGNPEIYAMTLADRTVERLTANDYPDGTPVWSPDGKRIAYVSSREGNLEIMLLDLATGETTNATSHRAYDHYPAWAPDSCRLAFVSKRDGDPDVWITNVCSPPAAVATP
jgi:Tol biopolymer transport system component